MKTYLIDLDGVCQDTFRSLAGFVLSRGLNFRKIDLVTAGKTGASLVVELANKAEETLLNEFLKDMSIPSPVIIDNAGKAKLDGKKLGIFCQVRDVQGLTSFYLDRSSGKKFAIQGGV